MKRKILLPTDFSKNALHAMYYAMELYKNDHCTFFVLNVFSATSNIIQSLINMEPGSELYETAKANSESGLAKVLDIIAFRNNSNPKHKFETISTFNNPVEAIIQVVEKYDIDIIVMGTKGETNSRKMVYGSTAVNVMEKVRNCPVLVVPEKATAKMPKEIVFPTGYKTSIKSRELNFLVDIAKKCDATIRVLHVKEKNKLNDKQKNNKQLITDCFQDVKHTFHTLSYASIPTALNCFVESRESDMVCFINKKHVFFGSILTQPLVKEISFDSRVPILVLHDLKN